ncbi:MAG TPA: FAD-dependent oxidoreductase [Trueperaceae bacterium]|nr:FAD-dependent oxidoreductase [Trueperaceae bacterium]
MDDSPGPRVAVVGAGPAGFYAAEAVLRSHETATVDIIDRLPTPYGLVRFGVAPDHQKMKVVTRLYERTLKDPRTRYLGNVTYGRDLNLEDLRRHYHAVVFAVGAATDRRLGVEGEDLEGSLSATDFVAWYNGHPDAADHDFASLLAGAREAVVIGNGNVAIDVTRVLAKSVEELAATDIADHALEALSGSGIERVTIVGRRGPAEAKFTTKELRELGELENADVEVRAAEMTLSPASRAAADADVTTGKNVEVLTAFSEQPKLGKPRTVALRFQLQPVGLVGDGKVSAVVFERTRLEDVDGQVRAVSTGEHETLPAQLVLKSVGYTGLPLPDLPFDERRGVVPNEAGRVLDAPGGTPLPGLYVAGWIKRGASGVIGTNKADAMESVAALVEDLAAESGRSAQASGGDRTAAAVDHLLLTRGVDAFSSEDWFDLDAEEVAAGEAAGRPRVKTVRLQEMIATARRRRGG